MQLHRVDSKLPVSLDSGSNYSGDKGTAELTLHLIPTCNLIRTTDAKGRATYKQRSLATGRAIAGECQTRPSSQKISPWRLSHLALILSEPSWTLQGYHWLCPWQICLNKLYREPNEPNRHLSAWICCTSSDKYTQQWVLCTHRTMGHSWLCPRPFLRLSDVSCCDIWSFRCMSGSELCMHMLDTEWFTGKCVNSSLLQTSGVDYRIHLYLCCFEAS